MRRIQWFSFIRTLGLILVLVYHFYKSSLPGGFLGVDVFFTFSGYLITALLIDELTKTREIKLKSYLRRRFYRIVPPLVLMVLTTLPFALLIRRDFLAGIGRQIIAALGFVTNFYEIALGSNYEAQFAPHLLLHTWSLAVEVHYYLFWGLFLWMISRLVKNKNHFRTLVGVFSTELAIISLASMAFGLYLDFDLSTLYFSSLTHSFPMFLGGILASFAGIGETSQKYQKLSKKIKAPVAVLGFLLSMAALIAQALFFGFEERITYQVGFFLASLTTLSLIFFARLMHDKLQGKEEPKFITYLANISYGMYLFHWPIYTIANELLDHWMAVVVTIVSSMILSTLSFYLLEPVLMGKIKNRLVTGALVLGFLLANGFLYFTVTATGNVGPFETRMTQNGLMQADNAMKNTRLLVDGSGSVLLSRPNDNLDNVLLIGDSVALDAFEVNKDAMQDAMIDVMENRTFGNALEIINNHVANGSLREYVVVALGVNSLYNVKEDIQAIYDALPEGHKLVIVTPYTEDEYAEMAKEGRQVEIDFANEHDNVVIADWYQTASDHPEIWEGSDGYHFSHTGETMVAGSELYINTIKEALNAGVGEGGETSEDAGVINESALVIGDSVMIDVSTQVQAAYPNSIVDFRANRNFTEVNEILSTYISNNNLPKLVLIAVGVNEVYNFEEELDRIVNQVPAGTRLVLITPYNSSFSDNPESNVAREAAKIKELAEKKDFVSYGDWAEVAAAHPEIWVGTDGVHLGREDGDYSMLDTAATYYTEVLVNATKDVLQNGKDKQ